MGRVWGGHRLLCIHCSNELWYCSMRLSRLLSMVMLLVNKDRISATELAKRYGISVRTVYRDIDAIRDAGLPVESFQGVEGGFSLSQEYKMTKQSFNAEDVAPILTAFHGMSAVFMEKGNDSVMEKISGLVPAAQKEEIQRYCDQIIFDFMPFGYSTQAQEALNDIHTAIRLSRCIRFNYKNLKGERTERTVEPISLVFKGNGWYLFAFCREKEQPRFFKITRVRELTILHETFQPRALSYWDTFGKEEQDRENVHYVLRFSAEAAEAAEEYFADDMIIKNPDGSFTVGLDFAEDGWIFTFILGFGDQCEVLEPEYARKNITETLIKTIQRYNT